MAEKVYVRPTLKVPGSLEDLTVGFVRGETPADAHEQVPGKGRRRGHDLLRMAAVPEIRPENLM